MDVAIVGLGKVGRSLFRALSSLQFVRLHRIALSRQDLTLDSPPLIRLKSLPVNSWVFICVPESTLPRLAQLLLPSMPKVRWVFVSGSLHLKSLMALGFAPSYSFHPLFSFAAVRSLQGIPVGLDPMHPFLKRLVLDCGAYSFRLPGRTQDERTLYHAAAVLAAGGVSALTESILRLMVSAGLPRPTAARVVAPMMAQVLTNSLKKGPRRALTGPVVRGDERLIRQHLQALSHNERDVLPVYRSLLKMMRSLVDQ